MPPATLSPAGPPLSALALTFAALAFIPSAPVSAQANSVRDQPAIEEILVTARKREESLADIPMAISVVSDEEIDRGGFQGLEDISLRVAGLQYHDQGGQRPGRFNSAIRFRGMDVNSIIPTFQLGSLFIDGNYVLGSTHSIPLNDVAQVEVIKGPQAAYFGRNTFGGAVNYITRNPSLETFGGEVQASAAEYDEFDISARIEGPIIANVLGFSVGARVYDTDGMFTASDGGKLGAESTNSLNGSLFFQPNDRFTAKLRLFVSRDDDGPPAGGFIGGEENNTCRGQPFVTGAGETVFPVNWFCDGSVPTQGEAISRLGTTRIIDGVTTVTSPFEEQFGIPGFLVENLVNRPLLPEFSGVPTVNEIGMEREIERYSLNLEYAFENGMSLAFQGSVNDMKANWIREQSGGVGQNYSRDPQSQEDYSVEARIVSDQSRRLRWLLGVNRYEQEFFTNGSGGAAVIFCTDTAFGLPETGPGCAPRPPFVFSNSLGGSDEVTTLGIFGALSFDVTDQITIDLEGRQQNDELDREGTLIEADTFLPRVIVSYRPNPSTNLYASYAKGVLPGEANPRVIDADAQELAQYREQFGDTVSAILPEEELDSYEIGWKQSLFDDRVNFALAAYFGEWSNQKSRVIAVIQETCDVISPGIQGCGPDDGTAVGQPASFADGTPVRTPRNTTVSGSGDIWGLELEGGALLTPNWSLDVSLAYARSEFTDFESRFITFFSNFSNVNGNAHARYPEWSGAISSTYSQPLANGSEWFIRGDWRYFGETYVSVANIATCDAYSLTNLRSGLEFDNLRIEGFVKNLFGNDDWAACARNTDFSRPIDFGFFSFYQGATVSPQDKRQVGVKLSYRF